MWQYVENNKYGDVENDKLRSAFIDREDELNAKMRKRLLSTDKENEQQYILHLIGTPSLSVQDIREKEWLFNNGLLRTEKEIKEREEQKFDEELDRKVWHVYNDTCIEGTEEDFLRSLACWIPFVIWSFFLFLSIMSTSFDPYEVMFAFPIPLIITYIMFVRKERKLCDRYIGHYKGNTSEFYEHKNNIVGATYVMLAGTISGTANAGRSLKNLHEGKKYEV